jgi:hypothetical protein
VVVIIAGSGGIELASANDDTVLVGVVNKPSNMFSLVGSSNFFPKNNNWVHLASSMY